MSATCRAAYYTPRTCVRFSIVSIIVEEFYGRRNTVINVRRHLSKVNRIHGGALFSQTRDNHRRTHARTHARRCCLYLLFCARPLILRISLLIIHLDEIDYRLGCRRCHRRKLSHLLRISLLSKVAI